MHRRHRINEKWSEIELSVFPLLTGCPFCGPVYEVWDQRDSQFGSSEIWHSANDVLQSGFVIMTAVCVLCVGESEGCSDAVKGAPYHPQ